MTAPALSQALARFIERTRYEDLPQEVVSFTKLCVLDWLGSALAGADQPPIRMIRELAEEMGGAKQAALVTGGRTSALHAALVNGAASHVVELDDIHKASIIHAATVVIPAALAAAEWRGRSGRDLIAAIAIGYDVCFRIGEAVSPSHYRYWHNTATCGTFGAAAAAGKLLGLAEESLVHALGNAGTQAAGLWEFIEDGAMSKQLHTGKAAMNGLLAALLAEKGFTGPTRILEGGRGFFHAMSEEFDASRVTERLGETFKIRENSFKIHASCRHTHPAIDLALSLRADPANPLRPEQVRKIRVGGYRSVVAITDDPSPASVYAAKFSLQFCVALALVKGRAGLAEFTEQTLFDPAIRALMERIEVTLDPDVDAAYPECWGTRMEVTLEGGDTLTVRTDYPKGDPENPVAAEELIGKFRLMTDHLPADRRERHIEMVLQLEEAADLAQFWPEGSRI